MVITFLAMYNKINLFKIHMGFKKSKSKYFTAKK